MALLEQNILDESILERISRLRSVTCVVQMLHFLSSDNPLINSVTASSVSLQYIVIITFKLVVLIRRQDPFDRLLITTAINTNAAILTADHSIKTYPVRCRW